MTRALLITGPPGAGKSSALDRLSTRLEQERIPYGAVEADELARGWPFSEFSEWAPRLGLVCGSMRRAGRELLLVVATVETDAQLAGAVSAIGAASTTVVCLSAAPSTVAARVAAREPDDWPGKAWLVTHAAAVAAEIPRLTGIDAVIDSETTGPAEIAERLFSTYLAAPDGHGHSAGGGPGA
jgi:hypothetical protein